MDYKNLFRKLDANLDQIESLADPVELVSAILERLVEDFRDDLGLTAGRLYGRRADHYVLLHEYPDSGSRRGFRIPVSYEPVQELRRNGFVLHEPTDPGLDPGIESALGVQTFAAICAGGDCQRIIAFSLQPHPDREHVIYVLNTVRHVINLKLGKQRLEDRVAEVREIQLSLLPASAPRFDGFDLHGATVPAEEVGGDLYDFIRVSERSLGVAVVDSAGHGLPAALQARDAIIGLRMGVEERMRITATIEKLNRIIARSALSSRFISIFYGELEPGGTFVYCNAGHPPPLLFEDGRFTELRRGGQVLGPSPEARYERDYAVLRPGAVLLAYTDGITEAESPEHGFFGTERLRRIVARRPWPGAQALVEAVFAEVRRFSGASTPADDQTVVAVVARRRDAASARPADG